MLIYSNVSVAEFAILPAINVEPELTSKLYTGVAVPMPTVPDHVDDAPTTVPETVGDAARTIDPVPVVPFDKLEAAICVPLI